MPRVDLVATSEIARTPRVMQVEGIFDLPAAKALSREWHVEIPLDEKPWQIGLICGPSGSGKSSIARHLFGTDSMRDPEWATGRAVIDGFAPTLPIKRVVELLTSVGFGSPPHWLRPFGTLSTGEQFRANVARRLAETPPGGLAVVDEWTSVVDRTIGRIASHAAARAVRASGIRLVAVTCHEDVEPWLQPDWVLNAETQSFHWRSLQRRPTIRVEIERVHHAAWGLFRHHHYLSGDLNTSAHCYVGSVDGTPAVFLAVLITPHATAPSWRDHRLVCAPDFQGVGLGMKFGEYLASLYGWTGKPYHSVTAHRAVITSRTRNPHWALRRAASLGGRDGRGAGQYVTHATTRMTATHRYVGPRGPRAHAVALGIVSAASPGSVTS